MIDLMEMTGHCLEKFWRLLREKQFVRPVASVAMRRCIRFRANGSDAQSCLMRSRGSRCEKERNALDDMCEDSDCDQVQGQAIDSVEQSEQNDLDLCARRARKRA